MKRTLLVVALVLLGAFAFTQERIAIFPFEDRNNVYTIDQLDLYYREFSSEFKNKTDESRFTVISRVDVEKIINMEKRFQLSEYSSKEITAELERVLNPKQILYILILKVDNNIRINVSRYTFPEMEVLRGGGGVTITNKNQFLDKIPELVQIMQNAIAGGNVTPNKTYKIGDYGPAGGIVFYDKGIFSNGWRYLEAAPFETEFTAEWGAYETDVAGTSTAVGSGKRNTEIIVALLRQLGERGKAAQLCVNLNFDGYKDWFLPSMEELDLIYKNLVLNKIGNFKGDYYWSSSQRSTTFDGHTLAYYQMQPSFAWTQNFSNGDQTGDGLLSSFSKEHNNYVRAIRAF